MTGYLAYWMQFYLISDQAAIILQYIEPLGQISDIRPQHVSSPDIWRNELSIYNYRYTAERLHGSGRESIFNLGDRDDLTHGGTSLDNIGTENVKTLALSVSYLFPSIYVQCPSINISMYILFMIIFNLLPLSLSLYAFILDMEKKLSEPCHASPL